MNLPNLLTVARVPLAIAGVIVLLLPFIPYYITIATAIFVIAAFTDWLDGYLARKQQLTSDFGRVMDPLADKILVLLYFVFLQHIGIYPLWLLLAVICRDLINDAYRNFAASQRVVIGANAFSKVKTGLQMLSLLLALLMLSVLEITDQWSNSYNWILLLANLCMLAALIIGVVGTVRFIMRHKYILKSGE